MAKLKSHFIKKMVQIRKDKYRILSQEEKRDIVTFYRADPSHQMLLDLSNYYKTSKKNINRWINQGINRKKGCGRKELKPQMKQVLANWCVDQSVNQGKKVSRAQLKAKALDLFQTEGFKASKAWLDNFIRNYNLKYHIFTALFESQKLNSIQKKLYLSTKQKNTKSQTQTQISQSSLVHSIKQNIPYFLRSKEHISNLNKDDQLQSRTVSEQPITKSRFKEQVQFLCQFQALEHIQKPYVNILPRQNQGFRDCISNTFFENQSQNFHDPPSQILHGHPDLDLRDYSPQPLLSSFRKQQLLDMTLN